MSTLAQAKAIAEAESAFWAKVEAEWKTPKNDLTATFVRKDAKARRETAEKIAAAIGALDQPPASSGKALTGKAQDAWSFDMEAAPRDGTNVIVAVASIHEGHEPIVGQAYIDTDNGGHWWWAGTSYGDYYASPIHETNNPPYAWHPMLDAPALPASSGQRGR